MWRFREGLETSGGAERVFAVVHLERAAVFASLVDRDDHVADGVEDLRSGVTGRVLHATAMHRERVAGHAAVVFPLSLMCGSSILRSFSFGM